MEQHCDMCAGPLPWKPYRAVVVSHDVTCCSLACVAQLRVVWESAPRYPVRAAVCLCAAIVLLTLVTLA